MICPNCGNTIKDESKFCQFCGTSVTPAPQPENAQAPAEAVQPSPIYTPDAVDGKPDDAVNSTAAAYRVVEDTPAPPTPPQPTPQQPAPPQPAPPYFTGAAPAAPATPYAPPMQQPIPPYAAQKQQGKGFAIASLILSLLGVLFGFTCCLAFLGTLCCILGVIFGAVAMKNPANKALALSGLIIGIVGFVLTLILGIIFFADIGSLGDALNDFYYDYGYFDYY